MFRKALTSTFNTFRFATEVSKSVKTPNGAGLTYYKNGELVTRQHLVLKKT